MVPSIRQMFHFVQRGHALYMRRNTLRYGALRGLFHDSFIKLYNEGDSNSNLTIRFFGSNNVMRC